MTSNRLVTLLRELTANQYSDNVLLMWLSNCENTVLTDVLLASPEDCVELTELSDAKLLVPHPWDKLYLPYMQAQVAHANGEYDHYGNYIALFNAYLEEYARHILETVQPAGGEAVTHGYYLSAYAIAVEHGYVGTVEQWLESLRGPQGDGGKDAYTIAVENGFTGTVEQWLASMKGDAATVEIVGADALAAVDAPTVTEVEGSTPAARRYKLGIPAGPRGIPGEAGRLQIVGADALAPGATPTVTEMAGSTAQYRLYRLGIPQGPKGDTGGTSLPIARAYVPEGPDDAYTATGDLLPTVSVANNDEQIPAVGKGLQIVFIPMIANKTESPKLRLNDGEVIPIRMRWYTNKGTDESVPEATTNVEVGSLMRGVPYTMTFCGLYWLIDSFVHCPTFVVEMTKSGDGTITVDKTFAQIKSAYAAGQQIVCACYDESAQWGDRVLLPLETFYERGVAHFGRVVETSQDLRELVTAYINSGSSGDYYGLNTWEIKDLPNIPTPTKDDAGKVPVASESGNYVLQTFKAAKDGKSAYQYAQDGGYTGTETEFAEKLAQKPLIGTTDTLTPTQVYDAVSAGIPVKVQYIDETFGVLSYTNFNIAESMNAIVGNAIGEYYGNYMLSLLVGNKSTNEWYFTVQRIATPEDIPTQLPNPNALTFTGGVTGSYDGSAPLSVKIPSAVTDDHINELINTALNAIGVAEEGAY